MARTSVAWVQWASPLWSRFVRDRLAEVAKERHVSRRYAIVLVTEEMGYSPRTRYTYVKRIEDWLEGQTAEAPLAFGLGQALGRLGGRSSGPLALLASGRARESADLILRLADNGEDRIACFHAAELYVLMPLAVFGSSRERKSCIDTLTSIARYGAPISVPSPGGLLGEYAPSKTDIGLKRYERVNNLKSWSWKSDSCAAVSNALAKIPRMPGFLPTWAIIESLVDAAVRLSVDTVSSTWEQNLPIFRDWRASHRSLI